MQHAVATVDVKDRRNLRADGTPCGPTALPMEDRYVPIVQRTARLRRRRVSRSAVQSQCGYSLRAVSPFVSLRISSTRAVASSALWQSTVSVFPGVCCAAMPWQAAALFAARCNCCGDARPSERLHGLERACASHALISARCGRERANPTVTAYRLRAIRSIPSDMIGISEGCDEPCFREEYSAAQPRPISRRRNARTAGQAIDSEHCAAA